MPYSPAARTSRRWPPPTPPRCARTFFILGLHPADGSGPGLVAEIEDLCPTATILVVADGRACAIPLAVRERRGRLRDLADRGCRRAASDPRHPRTPDRDPDAIRSGGCRIASHPRARKLSRAGYPPRSSSSTRSCASPPLLCGTHCRPDQPRRTAIDSGSRPAIGIDLEATSRDVSFCTHAIQGTGVMVVEDAAIDPRFRQNPLVVSEPRIRFYAGAPLTDRDGQGIGTLWRPRPFATQAATAHGADPARSSPGRSSPVWNCAGSSRNSNANCAPAARREAEFRQTAGFHEALIDAIDGLALEISSPSLDVTYISRGAERLLGYRLAWWRDQPGFWSQTSPRGRPEPRHGRTCCPVPKTARNAPSSCA